MAQDEVVAAINAIVSDARQDIRPLDNALARVRRFREENTPGTVSVVDRFVSHLREIQAGLTAPRVGAKMHNFVLPDEQMRLVELNQLLQKGPVVISVNQGHWCPYCRLNMMGMASIEEEIAAHGGQVVATVPDRQKFTKHLKEESGGHYPILTDIDNGFAQLLDLAVPVGNEMKELLSDIGWALPEFQGNSAWILPIPATFVVRKNGIIATRHIDPDFRFRMALEDIVAAVASAA